MPSSEPAVKLTPRRAIAIVQAIEQRIQSERLRPGNPLPSEKEICAEFGVSRTVVREALQSLKARGVVESHRGSGTFVAQPGGRTIRDSISWFAALQRDGSQFLELLDLRILVETECARRLASGKASLGEVRAQLQRMEKQKSNLARFAQADMGFHLAIVKASGHSLFYEVTFAMLHAMASFARTTHTDPVLALEVLNEHRSIYEALEKRSASGAEKLMRLHLLGSRDNLLKRIEEAAQAEPSVR